VEQEEGTDIQTGKKQTVRFRKAHGSMRVLHVPLHSCYGHSINSLHQAIIPDTLPYDTIWTLKVCRGNYKRMNNTSCHPPA
jgi:hypothetical protein